MCVLLSSAAVSILAVSSSEDRQELLLVLTERIQVLKHEDHEFLQREDGVAVVQIDDDIVF